MPSASPETSFKSRFKDIDIEHRKMIDFADMIINSKADAMECDDIIAMLNRFDLLCRLHFLKEEQLMKEMIYPLLAEHKQLHKLFLANLEQSRKHKKHGPGSGCFSAFSNIREDLITHLLNENLLLSQYIKTLNSDNNL
jgi:hemerythrin